MYRAKCLCVGCSDPGPQWGHMTHYGWALPGPPQVHLPWVLDSFVITANSETLHPHQIFVAPAVSQSPMRSRPTHENAALSHSVLRVPSSHCSPAHSNLPSDPAALADFHAVSIQTIFSGTSKVSSLPEQVLALNQTRQLFAKRSGDVWC